MSDHEHSWNPVLTIAGVYACECRATGYRHRSGVIVEHRVHRKIDGDRTVGFSTRGDGSGRMTERKYEGS